MEVPLVQFGGDLRGIKRGAESVGRPGPTMNVCKDCCRALGNCCQYEPQLIVKRNSGRATMLAFACSDYDLIFADMRPREAEQIAESKASASGKIDSMPDVGRALEFQL